MKKIALFLAAAACLAQAETIDVPAGQTRTVEPGRRFAGDVLVKTGAGELDLTGAVLANAGLEVRAGSVRLRGGGTCSVAILSINGIVVSGSVKVGGNDFDEAEEDKEKALFWYRKLADMGNSTAQFNLGIMYMKGEAVPQSFEKALEWMKKANENGDDDAEAYIERFSAIVNSQKKADAGNAQAIAELAEELMRFGMMVDDECADDFLAQSVEYAKKAADAGIAKGCWILGLAYSKGRGVETDLAQSARYYERGSDLGDAACQNSLGVFYVNGEGVRKDEKRAFALFQKSAGQGYGLAMYALGRCYQFGTGCKGNMKKALEWYEKASALLDNPELDAKVAAFRQPAKKGN